MNKRDVKIQLLEIIRKFMLDDHYQNNSQLVRTLLYCHFNSIKVEEIINWNFAA